MNTPLLLQQPQEKDTENSPLSLSVLEKITSGKVAQIPRWQFLISEYGIWILWGLSILIGALAFSLTLFFLTHAGLGMYEATSDSALDLFINVLPGAWVITFILMALVAHYNLRHTKRGYRYAVWQVLFSSLIFSLAGGLVLHTIGISFLVDDFVEKQVPMLPSLNRIERHIWQSPQDGRMAGAFTSTGTSSNDEIVIFTDTSGTQWQLDTSELNPIDLQNLYSGQQVHVIGVASSTNDSYFYGCGVFPWQPNHNMNFGDIWSQRQSFIQRMELHDKAILQTMLGTDTDPHPPLTPICAGHSAVMRIHKEFTR